VKRAGVKGFDGDPSQYRGRTEHRAKHDLRNGPSTSVGFGSGDRPNEERGTTMAKEFKQFLLRGSVVDLAVGIVIGVAFAGLVTALVKDLLTPLVGAIFGTHDFSRLSFTIHKSTFLYGDFLNALIAFVTIAAVVYFFVVKPVNNLIQRSRREPTPDPTTRKCPFCVSEIPLEASRCAFCTQEVPSTSAA
jgi:large conductance mechanosensitive channel